VYSSIVADAIIVVKAVFSVYQN